MIPDNEAEEFTSEAADRDGDTQEHRVFLPDSNDLDDSLDTDDFDAPVSIVVDIPEGANVPSTDSLSEPDMPSIQDRTDALDAAATAFAAMDGVPGRGRGRFRGLPKASEKFPFGAKERPVRKKLDIKNSFLAFFTKKSVYTNLGPILVMVVLVYSMFHVIAEKPYILMLNGEQIAYVKDTTDGARLMEQLNLELSSPYPAEANFRQYAVLDYTRNGVEIKTKLTDDEEIMTILRDKVTWFIDAWTISVSNERTVYLATRTIAEEVLDRVKKSYLPDNEELTILNVEFVESVDLIKEEIPVTSLGTPDQAFRTLTEGREPIREYVVQRGDSYWVIAQRNGMTAEELKLINGATSDMLSVGQVLVLNTPKPLLSVRATVS